MNWCFINEEINNFYILLFNVKFFNVWIWGFIYYFFILFGIFVIQIINYVILIIKDMRYFFIIRLGVVFKESYYEDIYFNFLYRYLKFDDEMFVIFVVWRDSYQLIEQYNEEQVCLY